MAVTGVDETPSELFLAGYAPLSSGGFALPCYAATVGANAWHVARCSVPGDHAGLVDGFDLYEGGDVHALPADLVQRVRVGELWLDVFVVDGAPLVGVAVDLWARLAPYADELAGRMPVSLLALALAAGNDDVRALAGVATDHMARRFGPQVASAWRLEALIAGEVRLAVRRALVAAGADRDEIAAARRVGLAPRDGRLIADLPARVSAALVARDAAEAARALVARTSDRLGVSVDLKVEADERTAAVVQPSGNKAWWPGSAVRILIAVAGPRAKAIARHVSSPDWVPIPHAPEALRRWIVRTNSFVLPMTGSVLDVVEMDRVPSAAMDGYSAVVWLVDDASVDSSPYDALLWEAADEPSRLSGTVHLLAPAPPSRGPSKTLAGLAEGRAPRFACHCLVDTALARSPLWTGNPWRAIDRRVADVVVSSAVLCALEGPVREELIGAGVAVGGNARLLSAALGEGNLDGSDPDLGLASESSATGLAASGAARLDVGFGVTGLDKSVRGTTRGYASLRRADPDFDAFARASVATAMWSGAGKGAARRSTLPVVAKPATAPVPRAVLDALDTPHLACPLEASGSRPFVVTAEAPTLRAVRAGWDAGHAVVRYDDGETIRELLRSQDALPLPRDLKLPSLRRLPENRGLAVRGVDPRDVVRLPPQTAEEWLARWGNSSLASTARRYLARVGERRSGELAFPRAEVVRLVAEGDTPAMSAADAAGKDPARLGERPFKRPNDLRAAWTAPGEARRFVLEDGRLPAELMELSPGVVPAQRMFIIDGDLAVPLLLSSRMFAVWARATTSWSTSWLSRFSVGRTFETLPVPPCFRLVLGEGGRPVVRFARRMAELLRMAEWLEATADGEGRWTRPAAGTPVSPDIEETWQEVDRVILDSIGLPSRANDAEVLQRLVEPDARRRDVDLMEAAR